MQQIRNAEAETYTDSILKGINPDTAITERVAKQIQYQGSTSAFKLKPILAYPVIDLPMAEYLIQESAAYIAPNISDLPNNSITLMESNNPFIESFMAGINHELIVNLCGENTRLIVREQALLSFGIAKMISQVQIL